MKSSTEAHEIGTINQKKIKSLAPQKIKRYA
jgi:hypothetical protein